MISEPWLQWALTICFCATGIWTTFRLFADLELSDKVGHGFHALMSAGMATMVWPWGMSLALGAQAALFVIATGWFLGVAIYAKRSGASPVHYLWHLPYHAVMMAAMAWMLIAMLPMGFDSPSHEHHHGLPLGSALLGVAFLIAMLAGGAIFAVDSALNFSRKHHQRENPNRHQNDARKTVVPILDHLNNAAMSFGMAAMIIPMVAA